MANASIVDQIVQSLAFEVEAVPHDDIELSTANTTPLKLRIRVKKKDDCGMQQGILSVPKFSHPERVPERIRLISSDQTIMSFDVSMEADFAKKPKRRPRKSFFGGCLGLQYDDDESTYLPSNMYNAKLADVNVSSKSDGVLKQHFTLSKTRHDSGEIQPYTRKPDILGKCKPGGCLDPPFGEEKYAYEPIQKQKLKHKIKNMNEEKNPVSPKIKLSKRVDIPNTPYTPKKSKDILLKQKAIPNLENNSILSIYEAISKCSSDSKKSESVITYPPETSSSITSNEKLLKNKLVNENLQKKSVNDSVDAFFSFPRKRSRFSENSKDFPKNDRTKNSKGSKTTKKISDESNKFLISNEIRPIKLSTQEGPIEKKMNDVNTKDARRKNEDISKEMHKISQHKITPASPTFENINENANDNLNYPNSITLGSLAPTASSLINKTLRASHLDDMENIYMKNDSIVLEQESTYIEEYQSNVDKVSQPSTSLDIKIQDDTSTMKVKQLVNSGHENGAENDVNFKNLFDKVEENYYNLSADKSDTKLKQQSSSLIAKQPAKNSSITFDGDNIGKLVIEDFQDFSRRSSINQLEKAISENSASFSLNRHLFTSPLFNENLNQNKPSEKLPSTNSENVTVSVEDSLFKPDVILLKDIKLENDTVSNQTRESMNLNSETQPDISTFLGQKTSTSSQLQTFLAKSESNSEVNQTLGLQNNTKEKTRDEKGSISSDVSKRRENHDRNTKHKYSTSSTFLSNNLDEHYVQENIHGSVKSDSLKFKVEEEDTKKITQANQSIKDTENILSISTDNKTTLSMLIESKSTNVREDVVKGSKHNFNNNENISPLKSGSVSLLSKSQSIQSKSDTSECLFAQQSSQSVQSEAASINLLSPKPQKVLDSINTASFDNKSITSRESKSSLKKGVISLDLAFQSYVNERKERTLKTVDTSKNLNRNPDDAITVIQSQLRPHVNEIKVPVDLENDMTIQIKRTRSPTQRVQIINEGSTLLNESKNDILILQRDSDSQHFANRSFHNSLTQEMYDKIACTEMQKVLNTVYEQELVPLQNTIKNLKEDVENIFNQQFLLVEELCKVMKAKPIRLLRVNPRCGCWRK